MKLPFLKVNTINFKQENGVWVMPGPGLVPENEEVVTALNRIKGGTYLLADIKSPRNYLFHKKYFEMLRFVVRNQDVYPNTETLLHELKLWLGLYKLMVLPSGKPIYDPQSISFAAMDNHSFAKFYSQSADAIMTNILPRIADPREMNRQQDMLLSFL